MVRPTTSPRDHAPRRAGSAAPSFGRTVLVAVAAGGVAVGAALLLDPTRRFGLVPASTVAFLATLASTLLVFVAAFAFLSPLADVVAAWGRSTPESERRDRSSGDGGFGFDFGGGDCGGDGGGCD